MHGLWRVIAYIAENQGGFNTGLRSICKTVADPDQLDHVKLTASPGDPREISVKSQPNRNAIAALDAFLRAQKGMTLPLYELAEVNRIVSDTSTQEPPHKDLLAYWNALQPVAGKNRDDPAFLEAVGALAIDGWLRREFGRSDSTVTLTKWFSITASQESLLRPLVAPGSLADAAADQYFVLCWPSGSCETLVTFPAAAWIHHNV
jgi:hypothetical protein